MFDKYFITDPANDDRIVGYVNEGTVKDMYFKGMIERAKLRSLCGRSGTGYEVVSDFMSINGDTAVYLYRGFIIFSEEIA